MSRHTRTAAALVIAALAAASCASAGGTPAQAGASVAAGEEDTVVLRVLNQSSVDFDVHVLHSGKKGLHRLGRVHRLTTVDFDLGHAGTLEDGFFLVAQPVGTTTGYVSKVFHARAGEQIAAQIAPVGAGNAVALRGT